MTRGPSASIVVTTRVCVVEPSNHHSPPMAEHSESVMALLLQCLSLQYVYTGWMRQSPLI
jgi:hypothetical protein